MKIKLDENLPADLVGALKGLGHDVDTVPQERLAGRSDREVWKATQVEKRFLVTQDLDFSDMRWFLTVATVLVGMLPAQSRPTTRPDDPALARGCIDTRPAPLTPAENLADPEGLARILADQNMVWGVRTGKREFITLAREAGARSIDQIKLDNQMIDAAGEGKLDQVLSALAACADVDARRVDLKQRMSLTNGLTALMVAGKGGHREIVSLLITRKASLELAHGDADLSHVLLACLASRIGRSTASENGEVRTLPWGAAAPPESWSSAEICGGWPFGCQTGTTESESENSAHSCAR